MNFIQPVKDKQLKKNYSSLAKHNNLIQGKYSLEASEQKLLYKIFQEVQKKKYETREVRMNFKEFYNDYKSILGKNITKNDFKTLIENLQDKKPYIVKGDEYIRTQWYSIHGKLDLSEVKFVLDEYVFEYIQSLSNQFTQLRLDSLYSFKSFHTMRLYELLKQWCDARQSIPFSIQTLKELFGVEDNAGYKNFTNFNKYVIEKAVKELNEKSELNIEVERVKEGRTVVGLNFIVSYKEGESPKERKLQTHETSVYPKVPENDELPKKEIAKFLIPGELSLDQKLINIFTKQFNKYDFSDIDYLSELLGAEAVALEKDGAESITALNYKLFATVLKNKLDSLEVRKEKEKNEIKLKIEDKIAADMLEMTALEYVNFMNECGTPLDYIDI